MSRQDDDARLYNCFNKYEEIVKQVILLDELTESMDPRRKTKCRGNNNGGNGSVLERESFDQVIVKTITKYLHDLNTNTIHPDDKPSSDR
ncbi:hypothetical protein JCGZ_05512 [Jatropha curcas]|uniref:Uncharacterized protein n=1 Tax=Jatropha curcas TaxID=180498 RepID=A0A067LHG7_JATCU|nr:hypothetical protein JCGZ_05512 [Jatropha curcas]